MRKLNTRLIRDERLKVKDEGCRCDERLKAKDEGSIPGIIYYSTPPLIPSTVEHSTLESICASNDRKNTTTIHNIISTLKKDDSKEPVKVDLITNALPDTDIQEYILRSYDNCSHFVPESSYTPHFQVTKTSSGDFLISCTQKSKSVL